MRVAYRLDCNYYRGEERLQLMVEVLSKATFQLDPAAVPGFIWARRHAFLHAGTDAFRAPSGLLSKVSSCCPTRPARAPRDWIERIDYSPATPCMLQTQGLVRGAYRCGRSRSLPVAGLYLCRVSRCPTAKPGIAIAATA